MVENRPNNGEALSSRVVETSLNGILNNTYSPENDTYNLRSQPLTLARIPNTLFGETIYLRLIHHPVSGVHLGQVLSEVAPFPQGYGGIKDDFRQMRVSFGHARRGESGGELHTLHGDTRIAESFNKFYDNHFKRWEGSLDNNEFSPLYQSLNGILYTYSTEALGNTLGMQWRKIAQSDGYSNGKFAIRNEVQNAGIPSYLAFLRENPLFLQGLKAPIGDLDDIGIFERFDRIDINKSIDIAMEFVNSLAPEDLRDLTLKSIISVGNHTIVDLGDRDIISRNQTVSFDFDGDKLKIDDKNGSHVLVRPWLLPSGEIKWRVTDHNTQKPAGDHMLPLLAWAKNGEKRRFVDQPEAQRVLSQIGFSAYTDTADVALGKVVSNIPMKSQIADWEKSIALKKPDGTMTRKQGIAAAQVPVWVDLPEHADIINSDFHYFKSLESAVS